MKIVILLDSSGTNQSEKIKNKNIEVLPLHFTFPNGTDMLDTPKEVKEKGIIKLISEGVDIKTSQASPGEVENKYDELLKTYDHIFHIPITGNLSSMLQTAMMVSRDDKYIGKVTVYENLNIAAQAIEQTALHISKLLEEGKIKTPEEITQAIKEYEKEMYIAILPGDLKRLTNGGRGKKAVTTVLNILKTKVLIKWEAEPKKEAMGRTINSIMDRITKVYHESYSKGFEMVFVRTPLTSSKIYEAARGALVEAKVNFSEELIPNIYTAHAGVDTIGFIITKKI
ncbi:putative fatty acid binding/lipid transport protein [Mesoplasma florum L1]|uniref:Fatty acid binding/lipid transport protein n=1 Tax=Mesoplasma florum (strain ATCC 33453 / NBRC 100688 / NCTC 11704 / L1) TaxID=265311 RepID=Q6F0M4_MESFL|nr:DegV family protein [Mesoplasma florum]AAT75949.1 putative fatty acid binding/lipid transport protein [Mesoplasma florum L1]